MFEAMTQIPPSRESSRYEDPEVTKFVPDPFRGIVQDCLRVDPLRRCTIESILERLDESKSIPISEGSSPVETDNSDGAAVSIPTGETAIPDKPDVSPVTAETARETTIVEKQGVLPLRAETASEASILDNPHALPLRPEAASEAPIAHEAHALPLRPETAGETPILDKPGVPSVPAKRRSETPIPDKADRVPFPAERGKLEEEFSEPALFSKSLTHFDESPLSRFRVLPFLFVFLAVALIAVLLVRGHKSQTPSTVASQSALAVSPPMQKKESAAPAPSAANQTEPETIPQATATQPNSTPQAEAPTARLQKKRRRRRPNRLPRRTKQLLPRTKQEPPSQPLPRRSELLPREACGVPDATACIPGTSRDAG